jgi:3'(2'), 5'-bisphosphate nucleotidase
MEMIRQDIINKQFIDKLLIFGAELSKEVCQIQEGGFETLQKDDKSPLTEADLHSNKRIREFLFANTEITNIISEEDKEIDYEERSEWDYYWLIDPIDGTKEFVKGGDDFCINIALCKGSEPVFGYVACPKKQDQYFAIKDRGAFKNGKPIYAKYSYNPQGEPIKIVASKSHLNEETEEFINNLKKNHEVETLNIGSSLKFCLVAEGEAHIYPRFGPTMEWDTCAPQIIAEESGADVCIAENSQPLEYNKKNLLNPFFIVSCKILK